jgi:hypothetical protein
LVIDSRDLGHGAPGAGPSKTQAYLSTTARGRHDPYQASYHNFATAPATPASGHLGVRPHAILDGAAPADIVEMLVEKAAGGALAEPAQRSKKSK